MAAANNWRELSFPSMNDVFAPVAYLLYKKGLLTEDEYVGFIEGYTFESMGSMALTMDRIDKMIGKQIGCRRIGSDGGSDWE